ncbi:MAG: TIGR04222 domain-containing membrane protein, partial [Planctomycetota bacterium]
AVTAVMALIVGTVGIAKLYLGIVNGRPVLFLAALLPLSLFVLFAVIKPREKMKIPTRLGRRYLKELRTNFEWLKEPATVDRRSDGIDPALSTALFGIGAVASASVFAGLSKTLMAASAPEGGFLSRLRDFFRIDYSRTWGEGLFGSGGGGCGGGCGGCGGGCGGGGCGGCGG